MPVVPRLAKVTMGGVTRVVDLLGGGVTGPPAGSGGDPNRWMVASSGVAPPIQSHVATANQVFMASYHPAISPPYPTQDLSTAFANWWTDNTGSTLHDADGVALAVQPEIDTPNPIKVSFGLSFDQGATVLPVAANQTLAGGATQWFDHVHLTVIPPNTPYRIYWKCQVNEGETRPGTYRSSVYTPCVDGTNKLPGARCTASEAEADAILNGGSFTRNESGDAAYYYGPAAVAAKGWDGRGVVFCVGDSILQIPNWRSWVVRGLEDTTGGLLKLPVLNVGVNGSRWSGQSSLAPGFFRRKAGLVNLLAAKNAGGALPFTAIVTEHFANDSGKTPASSWRGATQGGIDFLRATWPGVPITQTTTTPNTSSAPQTWQTPDIQSLNFNDTSRFSVGVDDIVNGVITADHPLNNTPIWTNQDLAGTEAHKWTQIFEVDAQGAFLRDGGGAKIRWTTTLAEDYVAGSSTFKTARQLPLGSLPSPAGQTVKIDGGVLSSVFDGTAWVNALDSSAKLPGSWPAGTTVYLQPVRDGTHPFEPLLTRASWNVRDGIKAAGFVGPATPAALAAL